MEAGTGRRPDLALLLQAAPDLHGGVARVVLALAGQFAAEGLSVDLVVTGPAPARPGGLPGGVRIVPLGARGLRDAFLPLLRYLRTERPRAMLSSMEHPNVLAVWARALARVPTRLVVSTHGSIERRRALSWGPRDRILMPPLIARAYRRADAVVAVSDGLADELRRIVGTHPGGIHRIHNPIYSTAIEAAMAAPCTNDPFPGYAGPIVLGAGRFTPQKGFPTLLRAFATVRQRRDARLVLLGDGAGGAALRSLAGELGVAADVGFPGMLDNPFPWMRRAAVFALSSAWEGFGNVLVEAMACGTPVVSTDCPHGPAEILDHGRFGRLVPVGDAAALAEAMLATIDAPPDRAVLVGRAQEFSVEAAARRYRALLGL